MIRPRPAKETEVSATTRDVSTLLSTELPVELDSLKRRRECHVAEYDLAVKAIDGEDQELRRILECREGFTARKKWAEKEIAICDDLIAAIMERIQHSQTGDQPDKTPVKNAKKGGKQNPVHETTSGGSPRDRRQKGQRNEPAAEGSVADASRKARSVNRRRGRGA